MLMANKYIADGIYLVRAHDTKLLNGAWVSEAGTYLVADQTKLAQITGVSPGDIAFTAGYAHIWQMDTDGATWVELPKSSSQSAGLTDDVKTALLRVAEKVDNIDSSSANCYQGLYNALYGIAQVESISAVLNLADHSVMVGDSVDTLKPYLTVTAAYSDSTTQTVTDYTLTGTIEAGTNTVTVTHEGKTTTFTVEGRVVPAGYTLMPSLYCVADPNVKILTGVMSGDIDYAEYRIMPTDMRYRKAGCVLGAANCAFPYLTGDNTNGDRSRIGFRNFGNTESSVTSGSYLYSWNLNESHTIRGYVNGKVYVDDVELFTVSKGSAASAELQIFKSPDSDSLYFIGRLYWMKFYKNGEVYRNYLPCKNSNNICGLYETVTGTFLYDANYPNYYHEGPEE